MRRSIRTFFILLIIAGLGFFIKNHSAFIFPSPVPVVAQTGSTDWPQLAHDAQHTGRTSIGVAPPYNLKWAWFDDAHQVNNFVSAPGKNLTDPFGSNFVAQVVFADSIQPIIAEGKVFVGDMDGMFYALDALSGTMKWKFPTGGPILATAAYDSGVVVAVSLNGVIYGIRASDGQKIWDYPTGAGITAAPAIQNGTVYVGSRDGKLYALEISTGNLKWAYTNRAYPNDINHYLSQAPIMTPPAVSADGLTVVFGAENMYIYALNTSNGTERWNPKQLNGQSYLNSWPVIIQDKILIYTVSSFIGAEEISTPMEDLLKSLPNGVSWSQEKQAVIDMLTQNPDQKILYVLDITTGQEPYQVAMGRVTGNNHPPFPFTLDHNNQPITYWRSRNSTLFSGGTFGSLFCPDVSRIDINTGDRIKYSFSTPISFCPELDNGFMLTTAGNYMYMQNSFRGIHVVNLSNATQNWVTHTDAISDCANWRTWGASIIYIGNDNATDSCAIPPLTPSKYSGAGGLSGISVATINGVTMFYSTEPLNFIGAFEHKQ